MDTHSFVPECPQCSAIVRQVKAGRSDGQQRFKCMTCGRRYIPGTPERGYGGEVRSRAVALAQSGVKVREVARTLGVNHQTVANWIADARQRQSSQGPDIEPIARTSPLQATAYSPVADVNVKRRPTIRDVAKKAGVCTATVSSYCNNKGRMGQETRMRIQAAMEELHYTPNALVRAIRQQRTGILGVLIFGLASLDEKLGVSLTPSILSGITEAADLAEHDLLVYTGWPNHPARHTGLSFLNGHIDGLLWVAPEMSSPIMDRLSAAGLPVVSLLSRHVPDNIGYVNADNSGAITLVVDHLASLGHTRIAYIGPYHSSNFIDRLDAYRQSVARHGLSGDRQLEYVVPGAWSREHCIEAAAALLSLSNRPTAIVAADDGIACMVREEMQLRGIRIPDDIAITGFNDILDAERTGLTTIKQPFRQIGFTATQKLLAMLEGEPAANCRITLPAPLIVRESTTGSRLS